MYRYICLLNALRSFATRRIIKRLVGNEEETYEILKRLAGLVEDEGEKLLARHDRIADVAIQVMFEDDEQGLLDAVSKALSVAVEFQEWEVIEQVQLDLKVAEGVYGELAILMFDAKMKLINPKFAFDFLVGMMWNNDNRLDTLRAICFLRFEEILELLHRGRSKTVQIQDNDELPFLAITQDTTTYARTDEEFYELIGTCGWVFEIACRKWDDLKEVIGDLGDLLFAILRWLHSDDPKILYEHGCFLVNIQREEEAIEPLQKAVFIKKDFLDAYVVLCAAAYMGHKPELATDAFDKAFAIAPAEIVNKETDLFRDYVMEFLALSGRLEDWLFLMANENLRAADTAQKLSEQITSQRILNLSLDEEATLNELSSRGEQMGKFDTNRFNRVVALSEWLRNQPLEVRREFARQIWDRKPHALPGDPFKYD